MTQQSAEPPSLRFLRLVAIAAVGSAYTVTFRDDGGNLVESEATVTDANGIQVVNFRPDLTYSWNGTAESLRRIARIVHDFHAAHTRRSPEE